MNQPPNAAGNVTANPVERLLALQLQRDVSIINAQTARELGPFPAGGLSVHPKRKPVLPARPPSTQAVAMPQTDSTMPPIPLGLQEMLKNYPQHLERLQEVLNSVAAQPYAGIPHFERAIWALEARLETFIAEARQELAIAEESGDIKAIKAAEQQVFQMLHAYSSNGGMHNLQELADYFNKDGPYK